MSRFISTIGFFVGASAWLIAAAFWFEMRTTEGMSAIEPAIYAFSAFIIGCASLVIGLVFRRPAEGRTYAKLRRPVERLQ